MKLVPFCEGERSNGSPGVKLRQGGPSFEEGDVT
jgi:hypothetical protein